MIYLRSDHEAIMLKRKLSDPHVFMNKKLRMIIYAFELLDLKDVKWIREGRHDRWWSN